MQKSLQHENVPKTIGESKDFEGHIEAKHGIVEIHLEFVACLTPRNRHVRETTGFMQRAERCKIEEIRLK